ncbi:MAG: glycosyltransferase [Deltaproteobacteria bacterium]|nr:glycosyltransferase [Deltaproteobacteria bacterium]
MNIAIVHEWISDIGGSEKVLGELITMFPDYHLFTLFYCKESLQRMGIRTDRVTASFLNRIKWISKIYRSLLPVFPVAAESLDISGFDMIISSSHIAAKGVIPKPYQTHICYCHTPARYLWDMSHQYLKTKGLDKGITSILSHTLLNYLRLWDVSTSNRVDYFIANSEYTRKRIKKYYNRDSIVIYPPVDTEKFRPQKKEDYFLFLSRLVPYKRADLAVAAFSQLNLPLVVAGDGPELKRLKNIAGKNIEFTGYLSNEDVVNYLSKARALIYPSEEDFGITMVEALSSGTPVIAYKRGGASEIIQDINKNKRPTGVLFDNQTSISLCEAVITFIKKENIFDRETMINSAEKFSKERFRKEISEFIDRIK